MEERHGICAHARARTDNKSVTFEAMNPNRPNPPANAELIDKEELRRRLNLPSVCMVEQLMRKRKIPYLRLGHKTVRFCWPKVLAALDRFEHKAIGQ